MKTPIGLAMTVAMLPMLVQAQTMVEGKHFDFKPAEYSTAAPPTLGPERAKGLVIWNHGRGSAAASEKASPLALYFGHQGWDVYTLYRGWGNDDRTRAFQIIQAGIEKAQAMGYRRIVLMGQSAGAYASIEAVRYGYDVDAVIATAPAAHGSYSGSTASSSWRSNDFTMRTIWEKYEGKKTKMAVAFFNEDDFYEGQNPNVRGPWLDSVLTKYGVPHFVITQPDIGDLKGHGAGQSWNFARRFGVCIYAFVETAVAPPCAEDNPATLQTFGIRLPPASQIDTREPYAGRWYGTWSGGRLIAIPIMGRQGDRLPARYLSGAGATPNEKPENLDWPLQISGNGIRRETTNVIFEFQLQGDSLVGTRTPRNAPDEKQTIVMRRAP